MTMGISPIDFTQYIIKPSLRFLDMKSKAAEQLLLGTVAKESGLGYYLHQVKGPALGVFQIEPATHKDLWVNYIRYKNYLYNRLSLAFPTCEFGSNHELLVYDLKYACCMARLIYYRVKYVLPQAHHISAQADYWKKHYNTPRGKGTVESYLACAKEIGMSDGNL